MKALRCDRRLNLRIGTSTVRTVEKSQTELPERLVRPPRRMVLRGCWSLDWIVTYCNRIEAKPACQIHCARSTMGEGLRTGLVGKGELG